jgi:hypothetical protein
MSAGWKTLDIQNNSLTIDLMENIRPVQPTIKEITRWIQM